MMSVTACVATPSGVAARSLRSELLTPRRSTSATVACAIAEGETERTALRIASWVIERARASSGPTAVSDATSSSSSSVRSDNPSDRRWFVRASFMIAATVCRAT